MSFPNSFFYQLEDTLTRAAYEINEKHMGLADIKARLAHIAGIENLTVAPGTHGGEVYQLGDQTVEVPSGNAGIRSRVQLIADGLINAVPSAVQIAEVDQAVAQADPIAVQVEVHKVITGRAPMKLQGLASKMALLKHNLEAEAEKLGNRVDGAATKSTETFAKSHKFLDATDKDLADVEDFVAQLDKTNGAPA